MLEDRFWAKVHKIDHGCWVWLGAKTRFGYGQFRIEDKIYKAHRLVYLDLHGQIPTDRILMHTCDNPPCINPDHLRLGTRRDNNHDRDEKGRHKSLRGEEHGMSRLTMEAVKDIKKLQKWLNDEIDRLATTYNVAHNTIRDVLNRRTWVWFD